ncbi:hypothetical protein HN011_007729, partial [Eciton burchellii]
HKSKNTEYRTYKPKQKRSYRVVLKHTYATANLVDIKKEIEDLRQLSIYEISRSKALKRLFMFYVELKPKNNNKDIYEVFRIQNKFESPHPK